MRRTEVLGEGPKEKGGPKTSTIIQEGKERRGGKEPKKKKKTTTNAEHKERK